MKRFFLFFPVFVLSMLFANAQYAIISEVDVTLDFAEIDFYIGNSEGNVDKLIRENLTTSSLSYSLDKANSGLCYKNGNLWWGIGNGTAPVTADKKYALKISLYKEEGFAFPADLSTLTVKMNGVGQSVEQFKTYADGSLVFFIFAGSPVTAPAATYTLTCVNARSLSYYDAYTGGDFLENTEVSFRAMSTAEGEVFDHWEVDGLTLSDEELSQETLTIIMPANAVTATAIFSKAKLIFDVNLIAENGVAAITDTVSDSSVVILATPNEGYDFVEWSDGSTDNPRTVELTGDTTITANFRKFETSSLDEARTDAFTVYVQGRTIVVETGEGLVAVYNIDGRLVGRTNRKISVPHAGVYFVKAKDCVQKVLVK